ncbi:sigma factor for late transcription [Serratia phage phiMAM1]|uniref:Sigma factor for late transcription n=2 Tax=Miltonvirus MAM1 TaxID=2169689 RepID=K7YIV2_9CAUD|nr:sigma factor for late transcription [Serratia phage phiMAM1]AFX93576.1 sigma factor for late transcription [Serratia phage phiMAM1]ASZ78884.1 sigma factor for late transcription [Serratia phage 2050H1]
MGMHYVDRGKTAKIYFTDEDNDKIVAVLREWIPLKKQAMAEEKPFPKVPEVVGAAVYQIVHNTSMRYNYRQYPFREDMVGDAVYNILRYLHTFDPFLVGKKSGKINFFSWVTMCLDRSFSKKIGDEETQTYLKYRSFEEVGGFAAFNDDPDFQQNDFIENTGIAMDFRERMGEFEQKREAAREKERLKAQEVKNAQKKTNVSKGLAQYLSRSKNTPPTADAMGDDVPNPAEYEFDQTLGEFPDLKPSKRGVKCQ